MKKHIFFDLDGTLADTDLDVRAAWRAAIADEGLECPDFERLFVAGPQFYEMAKIFFPERDDLATLAERLKVDFAAHYDQDGLKNTQEYPGVLDAVRELKAMGHSVYIVTNKRHAGTLANVRRFAWDKVFDGVYSTDMYSDSVGVLKKGALLKRIMFELKLSAADCVMVGDSIRDFEAAEVAGIRSLGVDWGYGKPDELARANEVVSTPAAMLAALS